MKIIICFLLFTSSLLIVTSQHAADCIENPGNGYSYGCDLLNFVEIEESQLIISTTHIEGFQNDDVERIYGEQQTLSYFPIKLFAMFKNIKYLKLAYFGLIDMNEPFFNCDSLTFLSLRYNKLTALNDGILNACTNLDQVSLIFNSIKSIGENSLTGLTKLKQLVLQSNQLTSLPENLITTNQNLDIINIARNQIKEIPQFFFANSTNLKRIHGDLNNFNSLPTKPGAFLGCASLTALILFETQIEILKSGVFEGLKTVEEIDLHNSNINFIESDVFVDLDNLKVLTLDNNRILSLNSKSFSLLPLLEDLNIFNNAIQAISYDFFNFVPNLIILRADNLNCMGGNFTEFTPSSIEQFECLAEIIYCDNKNDTCELDNLNIDSNYNDKKIFIEPLDKKITVTQLTASENATMNFISVGIFESFPELKIVNFSNVGLENVTSLSDCKNCENIETIILNYNEKLMGLTMNFEKFPKLVKISLKDSKFKFFDSSWITSNTLKSLNFANNEIISVNFIDSELTNLEILDLTNNGIITLENFSFGNNSNIRELYLDQNLLIILRKESFNGLNLLEILSITQNKLKLIEQNTFANLTLLKQLNLDNNGLQSLSTEEFGKKIPQTLQKFSANNNELLGISKHLIESLPSGINFSISNNLCVESLNYANCIEKSDIVCSFEYDNQTYFCRVSSAKVVGSIYPYTISGIHKKQSNNSIVTGFIAENYALVRNPRQARNSSYCTFNPPEINFVFPNLIFITFNGIGLQQLTDFHNCSELKIVILERNLLWSLSKTVFQACPLIEYISLETNLIQSLGDGIIRHLTNLIHFNFGDNNMKKIAPDLFFNNSYLEVLKFHNNEITSLDENVFITLRNLKNLAIRGNPIEKLSCTLIERLINLEDLEMQYLNLNESIPNDFLHNSIKLTSLTMNTNKIYKIDRELFQAQYHLKALDLSYCKISEIDENSFQNLTKLKILHLQGNQIEEIVKILFKNLKQLEILLLHQNKIAIIEDDSLRYLGCLKIFRLEENRIEKVNENLLENLNKLEELDFSLNNISMLEAYTFKNQTAMINLKIHFNNLTTTDEQTFKNLPFLEELSLHGNQIDYLHDKMFENSSKLTTLDLSINKLTIINDEIFDSKLPYLSTLNFSCNFITSIEPEAFQSLTDLQILILRYNSISTLTTNMFLNPTSDYLRFFTIIDISYNSVNRISSDFFQKISVGYFNASDNICLDDNYKNLGIGNTSSDFDDCKTIILDCKSAKDNQSCEIKYNQINNNDAKFDIDVAVDKFLAADVKNVTISSCNFSFIPQKLFETFENLELLVAQNIYLKKIEKIEKCGNLKTLVLDSNYKLDLGENNFINCINLQVLSINKINMEGLNVFAFLGLEKLQELFMEDSNITQMTADIPESVKILKLSRNNLNIDEKTFEGLVNLEELRIDESKNNFHRNSLLKLANLKELDISSRNISSFNFPIFGTENKLEILISNENQVEQLNEDILKNLKILTELYLIDNVIRGIQPTAFKTCCQNLKILNLGMRSKVGRIGILQTGTFDNLNQLEVLILDGQQINEISANTFKGLKNVKVLSLKSNKISSINGQAFLNFFNLEELDLSYNERLNNLPSEVFINLLSIKILSLENCQLQQLPSSIIYLSSLKSLDISQNKLQWLLFSVIYNHLESLTLGSSQITAINPKFLNEISENVIKSSSFTCATINDCTYNFDNLNICETSSEHSCKIDERNLNKHSVYNRNSVKYIYNKNTQLNFQVYEIFELYENVSKVDLWNSSISDIIGIITCANLQHFDLRLNRIESLYSNSLSECSNLEKLVLIKNRISWIDEKSFAGLNALKFLDLSHNQIENFYNQTFKENLRLEKLYLNHNKISSIGQNWLENLINLRVLRLGNNSLHQLNDHTVFNSLTHLVELHLDNNQFKNINEEVINTLKHLKYLNIEHNQLTQIDLSKFTLKELEYLDISSNQIMIINGNVDIFPSLRKFIAIENPCTDKN